MSDSQSDSMSADDRDRLATLIAEATRLGADAADAVLIRSTSISHAQRLGEIEQLERQESFDLGLRVFHGQKQAIVSSTDFSKDALSELVDRALAMAAAVPDDPWCGLADPDQLATDIPDLDMVDAAEPSSETLVEMARVCEDAARAVSGVTNSDGAQASWSHTGVCLAASNGFSGDYARTDSGVGVSVIAGEGAGMESEYDFAHAVHFGDLEDPADVGRRAGEKAAARIGARRMPTAEVPVIFDPRVAGGLLGHLTGAITGPAIARGTSFLKDRLGDQLFAADIEIVDDPHRKRGLRSKPFDAEGIANSKRSIVKDGVLTTWLLDLASAKQLGLETTGHAGRGTSGPPSPGPSNLYLTPGTLSPAELMADIEAGLYITSLMGMGVNGVTGDYSRGASGFWIENGEITFPVTELTIAGNLNQMFAGMSRANDLAFRFGTNSPTVRIDGLIVAGGGE
ncbi:MAG: TldD/PmbA family protein [Rhodospirillaceae bacterium]|jgi:PmbA protein|nr:TldD/PmbA family protein [Rhodospirillaceae bacterium]MBT3930162.1 TldD/PmbA family protein [Rhodospirillaceae bacterium]MBT4772887.1 TldD/PmbA family protein [Rhodospirillaceae bacterium]MBT5358252.1 TldD/PmbA family protein [Rhodospirillaceae bacterium]MBT5767975.1 TldD/PmbA family protein [Rhodospirillaceae bacterium]